AQRVADRLDSVIDPFSAENDQLARVLWLKEHTPEHGYGLGAVPWCGTLPGNGCPGVPRQMQSDYTFAAVHAVLGTVGSFVLLAIFLLWLAWLGVCWAVLTIVQTVVTVAGNLGALPLTGVTWPFVSYGLWSLLRNTLILGLVMHRPHNEAVMASNANPPER
ncbi:MAG TPA: FtsW/RodA/SpoVE family cell cycle protein, partial [Rubrivivax sp.]|nr:FtsW/RodA/SpoVE family cell cycle protein [Rubrivivax sp.]